MKELQKGNKAPYKGYLLNIGEYEKYCQMKEILERHMKILEEWKT